MEERPVNGILEDFRIEFLAFWERLPNKVFFFALLVAWLALFQFFGNSTLGYVRSRRLYVGCLTPFIRRVITSIQMRHTPSSFPSWYSPFLVEAKAVDRTALQNVVARTGYCGSRLRASLVRLHDPAAKTIRNSLIRWNLWIDGARLGIPLDAGQFLSIFPFAFCLPLGDQAQPITFNLRLLVCWLVEKFSHYVLAVDIVREGTKLVDPRAPTSTKLQPPAAGCVAKWQLSFSQLLTRSLRSINGGNVAC
jgi:hypothetical protein